MSFINEKNETVINKTLPLKVFTSAADYARWRDSLVDPATEIPTYNILRDYPQDFSITADNRSSASLGENYMILSKANMPPEPVRPYFTITSEAPMNIAPKFTSPGGRLSYSVDNGYSWTSISPGYQTKASTVTKFRGYMPDNSLYRADISNATWTTSGGTLFDLSGHLSTLLREDGAINGTGENAFIRMFYQQPNLRHLKDLQFPYSIGRNGAHEMFYNCINVLTPPTMPNGEIGESAFSRTFAQCTNLRSFPKLPSQTLSPYCYHEMFTGDYWVFAPIPDLPSYPLVKEGCYRNMFSYCEHISGVCPFDFGNVKCAEGMFLRAMPSLFDTYSHNQYQNLITTRTVQHDFSHLGALRPSNEVYGAFYR